MNFNSLNFLVFFPVVLLLHRLIPPKSRWILLLGASYYFYMSWNPWLVFLILGTTLVSYLAALGIERSPSVRGKNALLGLTLAVCLGTLFVFKYMNFFLGTRFSLILPVGISFYTFQTLSYVIDVRRGRFRAERHFGYYALYVSFFPQLVAGPIERPENLLPQLRAAQLPTADRMHDAFRLMLRGFAKKVIIADTLASAVDAVYASPAGVDGMAAVLATVFFALQIYCDFSGYSEIAMGAAGMLGIRLMRNFDRPYAAVTVRDFWRRWHISLTGWFTDYVYIPLGGSRRGLARTCLNTLIVFLLSGLWHGANLTFVVWGGLHGLYLIAERLLEKKPPKSRLLRRGMTLAAVCFGWIFFRAQSLGDAAVLLGRIFTPWNPASALGLMGLDLKMLILVALCAVLLWALDREPEEHEVLTENRALTYGFLILAVAAAWLIRIGTGAESAFLYFQF